MSNRLPAFLFLFLGLFSKMTCLAQTFFPDPGASYDLDGIYEQDGDQFRCIEKKEVLVPVFDTRIVEKRGAEHLISDYASPRKTNYNGAGRYILNTTGAVTISKATQDKSPQYLIGSSNGSMTGGFTLGSSVTLTFRPEMDGYIENFESKNWVLSGWGNSVMDHVGLYSFEGKPFHDGLLSEGGPYNYNTYRKKIRVTGGAEYLLMHLRGSGLMVHHTGFQFTQILKETEQYQSGTRTEYRYEFELIPEPSSVLLFALAGIGVLSRRARKPQGQGRKSL